VESIIHMKRTGSITEDLEFGEHFVVMASPCYICMPFGFGFFFMSATALLGYPSSSLLVPLL
jgi:hypothetical protein